MWNTQEGERTLKGAEREMFRRLADIVWYDLESELSDDSGEPFQVGTGVKQFDSLTLSQRFVVLAEVVAALMDQKVPMPMPTQSNEACIAAIYKAGVDDFLEAKLYPDARHLLRAVAVQWNFTEVPALRAAEADYREVIDSAVDLILWDIDYASDENFVDLPQDQRDVMHTLAGVHEDYFTTLVPDPKTIEPQRKLLKKWLGGKGKSFGPQKRRANR